jgi:RNA polymerase sigma factor (sigma-70 family)
MQGLSVEPHELEALRGKLIYLAWHSYRIHATDADDVVQASFATYFEIRDRYPRTEDHSAILIGVFRNKCREHIDRVIREQRRHSEYIRKLAPTTASSVSGPESPGTSVLEDLVREEEGRLILEALSNLRPDARAAFEALLDEDVGRKGLIDRLGLNKNTLDSRLHVYRSELRKLLRQKGLSL